MKKAIENEKQDLVLLCEWYWTFRKYKPIDVEPASCWPVAAKSIGSSKCLLRYEAEQAQAAFHQTRFERKDIQNLRIL